jgi:hypothetical protein
MHRNLIGLQRALAMNAAGEQMRDLLREAENAPTEWEAGHIRRDADRLLDDICERRSEWKDGQG